MSSLGARREGQGTPSSPSSSVSCSPSSMGSLFGFEPTKARLFNKVDMKTHAVKPEGATSTEGSPKRPPSTEEEFSPERYLLWHKRVLLHRIRVGAGRSHEMCRLYNFWLGFLPDKFNDAMYQAFKRHAEEDASAGHTYGLTCLFHFYLRYLSQDFEPEVYQDFETLALKYQDYLDYEEGMDCLCHFLTGASAAQRSNQPCQANSNGGSDLMPPASASHTATATDSSVASDLTSCIPATNATSEPSSFSTGGMLPSSNVTSGPLPSPSVAFASGAGPMVCAPGGFPSFSGSAVSSVSSGMLLLPPGLPRDAGVEVNGRVLEQLHAWQVARSASQSLYGYGDDGSGGMHSDAPPTESVTGSSEAGGDKDSTAVAAAHALLPKRLGRRPNGKLVQAMRRASARCPSPHTPTPTNTSPAPAHSAGSAPPAAGRFMPAAAAGSSPPNTSGVSVPPGARTKRTRGPKRAGAGRRASSSAPAGASALDHGAGMSLGGMSPPNGHAHWMPPAGGKARKSPRKSQAPLKPDAPFNLGFQGTASGRGKGSGGQSAPDRMEIPLWEAQPCGATCGAAAAEIAKVLPLRLGELFGD